MPLDLVFSPGLFPGFAAVFGLLVGSFLNVLIHRLPLMMMHQWRVDCADLRNEVAPDQEEQLSLWFPRSRCPACKQFIRAWDNIPVISWLLLRGRCRSCQTPISSRYPLVEILTALLFLIAALSFGPTWRGAAAMLYCATLLALAGIDKDTRLLPDALTLPLLWAGLLANVGGLFTDPVSAIVGAAAGYLSLWVVYWVFRLLTGKEGMGYGDFKLLAALGAWLGWVYLPLIVVLSATTGALVALMLRVCGRLTPGSPISFGPYLAMAGIVAIFWGQTLMLAYLHL
jgi:leader peptidase (prepilin peptidase)/N-methyltransferase